MINVVIKRNGQEEQFSSEKLNKLSQWTSEVIDPSEESVDWSYIALEAVKKLHDRCTTNQIVDALIQACIDQKTEGYSYAAGKLLASNLHKKVYDSAIPPTLYDHLSKCADLDVYLDFLNIYTEEEIDYLESVIDHRKDFKMTHSQVNQAILKYLVQDKTSKTIYETPQFMCMRIALDVAQYEIDRVEKVEQIYNYLSDYNIVLPTPMWVNLGTPNRVGTSCLLAAAGDTIGSLNANDNITYMMTTAGAGIGSVLFTRSKGMPIKRGKLTHSGKLPYFKLIESSIKAALQGSRGGAATVYISCLDPEIMTLLHLKNPTSIPEEKIEGIDYAFSFNSFFVEKAKKNEDWMLIDYYYAKDLYEAMYSKDEERFKILYQKYLDNSSIPKKFVKARDIVFKHIKESHSTGRLYEFNTTNANVHTAYLDPILSSNLCLEISAPTRPFNHVTELYKNKYEDGDGWVQTCNLAAINLNKEYSDEEYFELARTCLDIIDHVIDNTEYIMPQIGDTTKKWRTAGVSVINLANHLATKGMDYSSEFSKKYIHFIFERHEYMLLRASLEISKQRGLAPWIHKTKYPDGYIPLDDYNKNVDSIADFEYKYDWQALKQKIKNNGGIAHSALSTSVPSESSSLLSNSTNGIYPIRQEIVVKTGVNSKNYVIAPKHEKLYYQKAFDVPTMDLIHLYAIAQKFISQAISADFYYDLNRESDTSMKNLFSQFLARNHYGIKTKYYSNFRTQSKDNTDFSPEAGCAGGSCTL